LNKHEQGLAARRRELVERSTAQRAALVASAEPLVRKGEAADRLLASVRRYPVVVAIAVGAVALIGPRKLLDLGARALTFYMLLRRST
jgi:YqjK-like protein